MCKRIKKRETLFSLNLGITLLLSVGSVFSAWDISGEYSIGSNSDCALKVIIYNINNELEYRLTTTVRDSIGKLNIESNDDMYLIFNGLKGDSPPNNVQGVIKGGALIFQNTGNAMNQYTLFSECSDKYLILEK